MQIHHIKADGAETTRPSILTILFWFALLMTLYVCIRLSRDSALIKVAFAAFALLQLIHIVRGYKAWSKLRISFEVLFLFAIILGAVTSFAVSLGSHPAYAFFLGMCLAVSKVHSVLGYNRQW